MIDSRYEAVRLGVLQVLGANTGPGPDLHDIAEAIAAGVEIGLRRAGFDDDPMKRTMGRCDTQYGHPSHIWWAEPPTKPTDEAAWCDGLSIEPPSEPRLIQRYTDADAGKTPEHDDLRRHLLAIHCQENALELSDADALDNHEHEHRGPGTIRHHDDDDLYWDRAKGRRVLRGVGDEL